MKHNTRALGIVALLSIAVVTASGCATETQDGEEVTAVSREIGKGGGRNCGAREVSDGELEAMQGAIAREAKTAASSDGGRTIDVHFHVILTNDGGGDLTDAALRAQLDVLTNAFAGRAAPPGENAAETGFRFRLASVDRTKRSGWYGQPDHDTQVAMAKALRKGGSTALNVYVLDLKGTQLGHATFPQDYAKHPEMDGVYLDNTTLPGSALPPYNLGDTLVHEIGHFLGLPRRSRHVQGQGRRWQGSGSELHELLRRRMHVRVHEGPGGPDARDVADLPRQMTATFLSPVRGTLSG